MGKMNLVTFKSTNHVLGAAVRSTQPDKAFVVDDLAVNGIVVRDSYNARLSALVAATQLQIAVVDYDTRVFYRPQQFVVTDGRAEQQTELASAAIPALATLDGTKVTVKLPAVTASDIEVFVHITGGALQEPVVRAVPIAKTVDTGSSGLVLGHGDYTMIIFAPGYVTVVKAEAVP
jgi:uncharacterized protein YegL